MTENVLWFVTWKFYPIWTVYEPHLNFFSFVFFLFFRVYLHSKMLRRENVVVRWRQKKNIVCIEGKIKRETLNNINHTEVLLYSLSSSLLQGARCDNGFWFWITIYLAYFWRLWIFNFVKENYYYSSIDRRLREKLATRQDTLHFNF